MRYIYNCFHLVSYCSFFGNSLPNEDLHFVFCTVKRNSTKEYYGSTVYFSLYGLSLERFSNFVTSKWVFLLNRIYKSFNFKVSYTLYNFLSVFYFKKCGFFFDDGRCFLFHYVEEKVNKRIDDLIGVSTKFYVKWNDSLDRVESCHRKHRHVEPDHDGFG